MRHNIVVRRMDAISTIIGVAITTLPKRRYRMRIAGAGGAAGYAIAQAPVARVAREAG